MADWQGNPIESSTWVNRVRYSPSGKLLAIMTNRNLKIYNSDTKECVADMGDDKYGNSLHLNLLAWTPDGTCLLLTCYHLGHPAIQEWDTSTWKQVDNDWTGHSHRIKDILINPAGTLVATASLDEDVCLWRLSDRQTIARFQHSAPTMCVTFSIDGKHILSGGGDKEISEWAVPDDANSKVFITTVAARTNFRKPAWRQAQRSSQSGISAPPSGV